MLFLKPITSKLQLALISGDLSPGNAQNTFSDHLSGLGKGEILEKNKTKQNKTKQNKTPKALPGGKNSRGHGLGWAINRIC